MFKTYDIYTYKLYISSRATLNETFTATYDDVLPRNPKRDQDQKFTPLGWGEWGGKSSSVQIVGSWVRNPFRPVFFLFLSVLFFFFFFFFFLQAFWQMLKGVVSSAGDYPINFDHKFNKSIFR